jgi:serine/threonine protein kinase/tetratricopeptide (TPR) repeat protein
MNPERWDVLSEWLAQWRAADAAERRQLRIRLAAEHPDLVAEAESLAAAAGDLGQFLETPAIAIEARTLAAEETVLPSGTMVGPYRVVELLARGGMGDVYRATDVRLRRDVALKVLSSSRTGDGQRLERFMHEARVTASLDHPNIVRVFDVGQDAERAYLVAELLDGETLRARLAGGALQPQEATKIAREIATGLGAAHAAGLVHRDLKPDNIFLTRSGLTKILDFGIAKLIQDDAAGEGFATMTGVVLGTAGYLAPEQIRGEAADARADLFALGAVLFEMLAGARAFARPHAVETLHAVLHDPPSTALSDRRDLPRPLVDIILRLLDKEPAARYQSADDVIGALEAADAGVPVAPAPTRGVRWPSVWRRYALAAAAVIAVVSVVAGTWQFISKAPQPTLAVIPFRSIPPGPDSELLETGMAEAFNTRFSRLQDVTVLPVTATDRYRTTDPLEAGRLLGATHVLTGFVQREGDVVRVSVRLWSPGEGRTIWTATEDVRASSILLLQDKIVSRVLEDLAPKLTPDARGRLAAPGTTNENAFRAHLNGRAHVWKPTRSDLAQAAAYFTEAVKLDPMYADAWAGLGSAYKRMPVVGGVPDALIRAREAADHALQIDRDHAEAISVKGTVAFWYDWDYAEAERLLRKALVLQPSSADTQVFLAHVLSNVGRADEALEEIQRARVLDPKWPVSAALEGQFLHMARRHELALQRLDEVIRAEPTYWTAQYFRVWTLLAMERYDEAVAACDRLSETRRAVDPAVPQFVGALAHKAAALARLGRREEAEALLATLRSEPHLPSLEALIVHALGRDDEAIALLGQSADRRDANITFLAVDPRWDRLRHRPAFRALLRRGNLLEIATKIGR